MTSFDIDYTYELDTSIDKWLRIKLLKSFKHSNTSLKEQIKFNIHNRCIRYINVDICLPDDPDIIDYHIFQDFFTCLTHIRSIKLYFEIPDSVYVKYQMYCQYNRLDILSLFKIDLKQFYRLRKLDIMSDSPVIVNCKLLPNTIIDLCACNNVMYKHLNALDKLIHYHLLHIESLSPNEFHILYPKMYKKKLNVYVAYTAIPVPPNHDIFEYIIQKYESLESLYDHVNFNIKI